MLAKSLATVIVLVTGGSIVYGQAPAIGAGGAASSEWRAPGEGAAMSRAKGTSPDASAKAGPEAAAGDRQTKLRSCLDHALVPAERLEPELGTDRHHLSEPGIEGGRHTQ